MTDITEYSSTEYRKLAEEALKRNKEFRDQVVWEIIMEGTAHCGWTDRAREGFVKSAQDTIQWAMSQHDDLAKALLRACEKCEDLQTAFDDVDQSENGQLREENTLLRTALEKCTMECPDYIAEEKPLPRNEKGK